MAVILETELQSDLERLYKITGDLLTDLEEKRDEQQTIVPQQFMERLSFSLEDIAGTLQKDIFNIRHIIAQRKLEVQGA